MVKIWKTLPNGRKVERDVTDQEYITQGWREQGWVAPASLQKRAEDHITNRLFEAVREQPITYLKGLAKHYTIVKKLPNGKWAKRTNIGGFDYEFGGWKNNGWIIPSWAHRDQQRGTIDSDKARDYYTRQIQNQQSTWQPKRTQEQAGQLLKGIWFQPGPQYLETAKQLTSGKKSINPQYMRWQTRALKWARHNRRTLWTDLTTGTVTDKRHARFRIINQYSALRKPPQLLLTQKPKKYAGLYDQRRHNIRFAPWRH